VPRTVMPGVTLGIFEDPPPPSADRMAAGC
jgi:hypothetical protein